MKGSLAGSGGTRGSFAGTEALPPQLLSGEIYSSEHFLPAYSPVEVPGLGDHLGGGTVWVGT